MAGSGQDRRRAPRLEALRVAARLTAGGQAHGVVHVADASATGLFVECAVPDLPFRTRITLRFPGSRFELKGEIVHVVDEIAAERMGHAVGYGVHLESPPSNVVARLVALHHGEKEPAVPPISRIRAESPASTGRRRPLVLIVDDDQVVCKAVCRILETIGCRTIFELTGRAGQERFAREVESIDLMLVDALLPDIAGADLIRHCRKTTQATPIIAISGVLRSTRSRKDLLLAGANEFLAKPFDGPTICRHVLQHLKNRRRARRDAA